MKFTCTIQLKRTFCCLILTLTEAPKCLARHVKTRIRNIKCCNYTPQFSISLRLEIWRWGENECVVKTQCTVGGTPRSQRGTRHGKWLIMYINRKSVNIGGTFNTPKFGCTIPGKQVVNARRQTPTWVLWPKIYMFKKPKMTRND